MTKKIFTYTFLLGISILTICAVLIFAVRYSQSLNETYEALKVEAGYAAGGLRIGGREYLENLDNVNRITWLAGDGGVLYDSEYPELKNQKDYQEVAAALSEGEGKCIRRSDSGGVNTMYYAFLCEDGTVLRLSRPLSAIRRAFTAIFPLIWVFILLLIASGILSFRVARQILKPVNELNLDDPDPKDVYPELEPLVRRIQEQKTTIQEEAEQREQLRREFSANVSHELRTPLTSISGFAELMKNGMVPPEKMPEFAGDIYKEAQHLIGLVDDIMQLSRLDEEAGFPEKEAVDLYELSSKILDSLRNQADARKITLNLKGTHEEILAIRPVIYEMIFNLADNAIKYNRYGGTVTVEIKREDGKPSVLVSDTGIGIPQEDRERVFERFYRVDKSHSKEVGGTGLGLSIVKHGARLHDAKITLTSSTSRGTKVQITFPEEDSPAA